MTPSKALFMLECVIAIFPQIMRLPLKKNVSTGKFVQCVLYKEMEQNKALQHLKHFSLFHKYFNHLKKNLKSEQNFIQEITCFHTLIHY